MDESPLAFAERWRRDLHAATNGETTSEQPTTAAELVKKLSLELNNRARDLPAYERQKCQRELEAVQKGLNESAAKAAPKPKFAFKRRAAHPLPASDNASPPPPPPPSSTQPAAADASGGGGGAPADALTLANQSRAHLSRADLPNRRTSLTDSKTPRDNSDSQCLALTALSECVVDLLEPTTATEGEDGDGSGTRSALTTTTSSSSYSAIYISGLRDSLVLLPENARQGSVLVQNCSRCVFVLGGHQIRIHDSEDCSFFLAAGSQPIIERCRELVFGPYPSSLLLESNSLTNRFDAVQDFDDPFATSSRPSQNWRLATEADRASLDEALARYFSTGTARGGADGGQAVREGLLQSVLGRV
ncbi:hypothetical protein JCM8115_004615 [Rhodotorula mucilaginosa]